VATRHIALQENVAPRMTFHPVVPFPNEVTDQPVT
jgi:hypothetical protein